MIDIIIPAYNAHKTIEKTLYSIAYQDIKNMVNVYIVNDCSDTDYSNIVNFFSKFISVTELKLKKNSGPGVARQCGVEHSNSEFIVFIDADDVFANCFALKNMYEMINKNNCDVVVGNIAEEIDDKFKIYRNSHIWLHGKMYRRNFIDNFKIHFNSSRYNEDNGFNQLLFLCNPKVNILDENVYIWRNNFSSITRKKNYKLLDDDFNGYIYNMNWAMSEALKRSCDMKKFSLFVFSVLVAEYHYYLQHYYETKKIEKVINLSKKTFEYYELCFITESEKYQILKQQFDFVFDDNNMKFFLNPIISFDNFLIKIKEGINL